MRTRGAGYEAHKAPLDWFIGAWGPAGFVSAGTFHPVGSCVAHARNGRATPVGSARAVANFDLDAR